MASDRSFSAPGPRSPGDLPPVLLDPGALVGRVMRVESLHAPGCGLYMLPDADGRIPGAPITARCTCGEPPASPPTA